MRTLIARLSTHQRVDVGVLLLMALLIALYLYHVLSLSTHILNVVLVLPVSVVALLLCALELIAQLQGKGVASAEQETVRSVLPVMVLFSLYVVTIPWLGFDVGTTLFVAAFIRFHGERRWFWALAYGLVFGFGVAAAFNALLPYPMPMAILPSEF